MKKSFLFFITFLVLSVIFSLLISSASASNVIKGLTFHSDYSYQAPAVETILPATYEATVYFPGNIDKSSRGGVIFGNYQVDSNPCVNFEIYTNGNPRLFVIENAETIYDVIFDQVNVYTGRWTHVAITLDTRTGEWCCYLDGMLKQSITAPSPTQFTLDKALCLGGDLRGGNSQYFKGTIKNVAIYSDVRTSKEIASDYPGTGVDTSGLLAYYDLSDISIGTIPEQIPCKFNIGQTISHVVKWITEKAEATNYAYSFALIGDTQSLTCYYPDKLTYIYDWIVKNKESKNIQFVFGLGDITDTDTDVEWTLAKSQITKLNGVVPYSLVRGNHDGIEQYTKYLSYEEFSDNICGSYDGTMLNTYQKLTVGDIKYLIVNLDVVASDSILDWANKIISDHPDYNVIVTMHIYLLRNYSHLTTIKYGAENSGEQIWEKLISKHKNIVLTICGHSPTDKVVLVESTGENGNYIPELLVDPQTIDLNWGGTGLVCMLYFSEDGSNVQVEYYSTIRDEHFLPENQFSFNVNVIRSEQPETNDNNDPQPTLPSANNSVKTATIIAASVFIVIAAIITTVFLVIAKHKKQIK